MLYDKVIAPVTTNPAILGSALAEGEQYDVHNTCDLFSDVFNHQPDYDGRVSIEVEPGPAMDTDGTTAEAADLSFMVDRPNVLTKIPVTKPGPP